MRVFNPSTPGGNKRSLVFKVTRVVNMKLGFMNWFLYYLIIPIEWCKIPYKTLDKTLLFSRNQGVCLKNWKFWRAPTTVEFNLFCWNLAHISYLPMSTKGCSGFFLISFRSWVIKKTGSRECVKTRSFSNFCK